MAQIRRIIGLPNLEDEAIHSERGGVSLRQHCSVVWAWTRGHGKSEQAHTDSLVSEPRACGLLAFHIVCL